MRSHLNELSLETASGAVQPFCVYVEKGLSEKLQVHFPKGPLQLTGT